MAFMNDTEILTRLVQALEIGLSSTAGNLVLIPLMGRRQTTNADNAPEYLLYQQSHDMGLVAIEEVSEAGIVGKLRVHNRTEAVLTYLHK